MNVQDVLALAEEFAPVGTEVVDILESAGRVLAEDIFSDMDLPDFSRSTMDGYAVQAASTFGATESAPAYMTVVGSIAMGETPAFSIRAGQAARISTGAMLPPGADGVVMIEHTACIDDGTIEVYRSIAPGQHVIEKGEDYRDGQPVLSKGTRIRPQETGLLAAFGKKSVRVFKKPVLGIISTGDEIVEIDKRPAVAQIRDINTYTLCAMAAESGAAAVTYGIVRDDYEALFAVCAGALEECDTILVSGGSSVGVRDFTIDVLSALPEAVILAHGISISPGKPTILARTGGKAFWGLPGHVVSAMIVYKMIVAHFIDRIAGVCLKKKKELRISAVLSRNISSVTGRVDYVRAKLTERDGVLTAEPILGKSGLIHTMVKADGLIEIGMNTEGLVKGEIVKVLPF